MIPNLFTGQPSWLILLCLLLAGTYAIALYFREKKNEFPLYLKILLGIARFAAVFFISFLLLSPYFRSVSKEKEEPVIIFALDNTQSVLLNADSSAYKESFLREADRAADNLGKVGEVRKYLFGNQLDPLGPGENFADAATFSGQVTDISQLFGELSNLYVNMNVGALILATDGIYNTGANPVYTARDWPHPVYTVALGDTTSRKDLILAKVNFNRMVFLNNKFPVEIVVRASDAEGSISRLKILQGTNILASQDLIIDKNDITLTFRFVLDAGRSGLQKYSIVVDPVEGELSPANNRKEIYIEVLDAKSKILLISAAPHPDISALKQAILSNMNYEVDAILLDDFNGKPEEYSMIILHQIPSKNEPSEALLKSITERQIPTLFILGTQSDFNRFNQWSQGLRITTSPRASFDETVPWINPGFTAFSLNDNTIGWLADLPPLISPLGDYQVANSARVLLKQRIGSVETTRPMVLFNETLDGRSGVITGEGIWKWRMYNYALAGDHLAFDELINKMVQYLSLKDQKKNFRVYNQTNFNETESVIFDAEVYNESYEMTTEPEVEISISNEEDRQFPFVFNKTGTAYHLDAGSFPPGNYSWQAQTRLGATTYNASGQFSVSTVDLEAVNTIADHQMLYQLANAGGGKMFYPAGLEQLTEEILAREDIRPVTYSRKKYEDLLNKGWLFALILGLLSLEWFLRKRAGSY